MSCDGFARLLERANAKNPSPERALSRTPVRGSGRSRNEGGSSREDDPEHRGQASRTARAVYDPPRRSMMATSAAIGIISAATRRARRVYWPGAEGEDLQ